MYYTNDPYRVEEQMAGEKGLYKARIQEPLIRRLEADRAMMRGGIFPPFGRAVCRARPTYYALTWLLCSFTIAPAALSAADKEYLVEREPKKLALIIGNWDYKHLSDLGSAETDAQLMAERLRALGFDVDSTHINVPTHPEFFDVVFQEFRKKIDVGDFVVFYFSGHGFSYGPHNYLAPTDIPPEVPENRVTDFAISVDSVKDRIASHKPGLIIFILDACRTIGGFVIKNKESGDEVPKGRALMENHHEGLNSIICYATEPGRPADGFSERGRPSIFTKWLAEHILAQGQPLRAVFDTVITDVRIATNHNQVPGRHDWSVTDPYLKPAPKNIEEQRDYWHSVLETRLRERIEGFAMRYSVSLHAYAARKWLADNLYDGQANSFTLASPVAIDRAYRPSNEDRVAVRRVAIPLAFPRSLEEGQEQALRRASDSEVGLVPSGTTRQEIARLKTGEQYVVSTLGTDFPDRELYPNSLAFSLANIDAHGTVVATRDLVGRAEPRISAMVAERISSGARLQIDRVELGADKNIWVQASTPGRASPFYLMVESGATPMPLELGQSISEIVASPRPDSIPELINPAPIQEALADLKAKGWKITWVSLSTAPTDDGWQRETRAAMIANAEYLLKRAGIDGRRITSVSGRDDFSGEGVRVRFFGIK
jgi:hypothetical protein